MHASMAILRPSAFGIMRSQYQSASPGNQKKDHMTSRDPSEIAVHVREAPHLLPQQLLAIQATEVKTALDQASQLIVEAFRADKVDVFLHDPAKDTLVAMGTSKTPLGDKQKAVGLDWLPVANRGRQVEVYLTGEPYLTGHAEDDPGVLLGVRETLGIRSMVAVPLAVNGARRGILSVTTVRPDAFPADSIPILQSVAHWVGLVLHRAELVEQIARDAAEQARRGVAEELITALAHDLRNLMAPAIARIGIIHRNATREGLDGYVRQATQAEQALRRMQALIADLLDAARLEQGIFTLNREHVNLAFLVEEVAALLRREDQDIQVRVAEELCAEGDPARIRQALENLVTNAVQHSPAGVPVMLDVSTRHDQAGTWAVVEVRDAGPGITPELLPHIFSRFRAGAGSHGLGLGLYLAHGIATAHGGSLEVASAVGEGARFCLSLPACDPHQCL